MKINESGRLYPAQAYKNVTTGKAQGSSAGGRSMAKDNVNISPEAMELLEAQRSNSGKSSERIAELKSAVQAGTYRVNSELLAEKLLPYLK